VPRGSALALGSSRSATALAPLAMARTPAPAAMPAAQPPAASAPARRSAHANAGPYVGMALAPHEIESILAHAGSGCPLGPCRGCPHNDVRTGACTA
jgi:hypothetical protein